MSEVLFASAKMKQLRPQASLPAKFQRQLDEIELEPKFKGKSVAIKMHLGGNLGYTTIPPLFVKLLVDKLKAVGASPFVTDTSGAVKEAKYRGYVEEALGCPIVPAAGLNEKYFITKPIGFLTLDEIQVCGEIVNADAMIVYSHGKGHGMCGWGGAIKNIAMGCVVGKSRGAIHAVYNTELTWDEELCTHCELCSTNCPNNAIKFSEDGKMDIFFHDCKYCNHCVTSCPQQAITIEGDGSERFQGAMARTTKAILDTFEENSVLYINQLTSVTPFCDCWGFSSPSIVPDVGILVGTDIVSVEKASIDMIRNEDLIPGSIPEQMEIADADVHLLQKLHKKDPYLQCVESAKVGLGSMEYTIKEIE